MQRWTKERKSRCGCCRNYAVAQSRCLAVAAMRDSSLEIETTMRKQAGSKRRKPSDGAHPQAPAIPRPLDRSTASLRKLTHVDDHGRARMVDVSNKPATVRQAVARGEVRMMPQTLAKIKANDVAKGDVLAVARIAGVMAAKRTDELIPLAHPLALTGIDVTFSLKEETNTIEIMAVGGTPGAPPGEMGRLAAGWAPAPPTLAMFKAGDPGGEVERIPAVRQN